MGMDLAAQLIDAREQGRTIARPSQQGNVLDLDQGYKVYNEVDARLRSSDYSRIGRKIGFSNKATWEEFELSTPIWAYVYDQTVSLPIAATGKREFEVSTHNLVAPRLEPEIVLKVNDKIAQVDPGPQSLIKAIEWVAIGFEVVDCHYVDWKFSAPEIIADFGAHAQLIVGNPLLINENVRSALTSTLETTNVKLLRDSTVVETGVGSNALGGPIQALGFLMQTLAGQRWAESVQPGEIITTGTLTPFPYIRAGERWTVDVAGIDLTSLSIVFTA